MHETNGTSSGRDDFVGWRRAAVAAAAGLLMLGILSGTSAFLCVAWLQWLILPVAVIAALFACRGWWRRAGDPAENIAAADTPVAWALCGTTTLYLFSGAANDVWFCFLRWSPSPGMEYPLLKSGIVRFCALTALLTPVFLLRIRKTWLIPCGAFLFLLAICAARFWSATGGAALYRDDHPSFLYRFWVFARTFPRLIYYDPFWNGGTVGTSLLATGVAPLGLLFWPLWRFLPVEHVYTPVLAITFLVLVPLLAVASVRIIGGKASAAWSAAILALGVSRFFFLWLLHFGTLGSCFALPFVMPLCACLYRVLWMGRTDRWLAPVLVASGLAFLAWPPSFVLAVCFVPALLFSVRQWSARKLTFLAACGATLAILCLPFVAAIVRHSNPIEFAQTQVKTSGVAAGVSEGWKLLCDHLRQGNPALLFFGLLGLWFLPGKGFKAIYGTVAVGLALVAGWADAWKPQLQLSRAGIPLFFLAISPAALWIGRWLDNAAPRLVPVRAVVAALLLMTGLNAARVYGNKGLAPFATMNKETHNIIGWIREHVAPNVRILFAGASVHAYGGGHVAFLPVMTDREMMACDYYHFSNRRVEYDFPPRAFREEDADVFRFLDLYNAGYVITYHESWMNLFRKHPDLCEEVCTFGEKRRKSVFRIKHAPALFAKGSGKVTAAINELTVTLDPPADETVLRYNWVEGLSADAPVEIYPCNMGCKVRFIGIRPHGCCAFKIKYTRWL